MFEFLRRKIWPPNFQNPPWGNASSIYDHVAAHIDANKQSGLLEGGDRLPDEPDPESDTVSFIPGAMDGILAHHDSSKQDDQLVSELHAAIKLTSKNASERNVTNLYSLMKQNTAVSVVDSLIDKIHSDHSLDLGRLREIVYWFTTKASDREPVKCAMALLGSLRGNDDSEIFLTLGRHDEFSLYSAVAIANNENYGKKILWELAQSCEGWGRISAVECLAKTSDPDVKNWLVREGYKNDVMYEYLACICARAGELHLALLAEEINDELFNSACEIIDTLVSGEGGPAEGLADYEHGCAATKLLLRHGKGRFASASHYWFLSKLKDRINEHLSGEKAIGQDWSAAAARDVASELSEILDDDGWKRVVIDALEGGGRQAFRDASRACEKLGIDPWPYFFRRTESGEDYWWDLMRTTDDTRIERVLELGSELIPLERIATGPSNELGLGLEYSSHTALGFILQDLDRFPGKGWAFVAAGLQSPVIRNRNMALRVLSRWGDDGRPEKIENILIELASSEPNEDVRVRVGDLLAGREMKDD